MKNIDELFDRPQLTAAQDYYGNVILENKICGGLMVVEPSESDYTGLMNVLYKETSKQWHNGEQQLVDYYYKKQGKVRILDSTWSTFVNTMCPSTEVQRVGHFTHW
jgi:alpha-N-acetylglucosamine transferase